MPSIAGVGLSESTLFAQEDFAALQNSNARCERLNRRSQSVVALEVTKQSWAGLLVPSWNRFLARKIDVEYLCASSSKISSPAVL